MRRQGLDLRDHREFPGRVQALDRDRAADVARHLRDQVLRTEVFDAIRGVFADYDLLVAPDARCLPVDNADDGETVGPARSRAWRSTG